MGKSRAKLAESMIDLLTPATSAPIQDNATTSPASPVSPDQNATGNSQNDSSTVSLEGGSTQALPPDLQPPSTPTTTQSLNAEPKQPTESERYFQGELDRAKQALKETRTANEKLYAEMSALKDLVIQRLTPPTPEPQTPDWGETISDPNRFNSYLKQVTSETLKKDSGYDPVLQEKVKYLMETAEFRMEHPESLPLTPFIDRALVEFPELRSQGKAGMEKALNYVKGFIEIGQSLASAAGATQGGAAKPQSVNQNPNAKRALTPEQVKEAEAAAAALKTANEQGVALGTPTPTGALLGTPGSPQRRRAFIEKALGKQGIF